MNYIQFDKVDKSYGYDKIFNGLSFKVLEGEHVGLLGSNGTGKTTIFRMIIGDEGYDSGRVLVRNDIRKGYLEQEISDYNGMKTGDILRLPFSDVFEAISGLRKLEKKLSVVSGIELEHTLREYGELQSFMEFREGYSIDSRIIATATGLGIDAARFNEPLDKLSGGEKTRIFLCKLLLEEPDLLLLDEPTNHLDIIAVGWLEEFLSTYKGTVLVVSHDRTFLDNSTTKIIEIENGGAEEYPGNYSWYKEEKKRRKEVQEKQYDNQQREIKRLEKSAKQMREWARQADNAFMYKRAVNVERRIERLDKVERPNNDKKSMDLNLSNSSKSSKEVIRLDEITKSFSDKVILNGVSLLVRKGEKVVISGENGSGKTTIINILNGSVQADSGFVRVGEGIIGGFLPQDIVFEDEERSLLDETRRALATDAGKAHKVLASYGFPGENVMKRISDLSGGERKRLRLCTMMQQDYNLLVMDEPTNHMDIVSREILEEALFDFTGTCVFVSHDRFFINRLASDRYLLKNGCLAKYTGDYTSLLKETPKTSQKLHDAKSRPVLKNHESKNMESRADSLEHDIKQTEGVLAEITQRMSEEPPYFELRELFDEKTKHDKKLEELYEKWFQRQHQ